jgi:hypothetical protein
MEILSMIPQRLNVGPSVVEVHLVENLTDEKGESLCGYYDSNRGINLNISRLTGIELADTLLHETIHALFYVYGWGSLDSLKEENVAALLGTALAVLLRDNPELPIALLRLTALGSRKVKSSLDKAPGLN